MSDSRMEIDSTMLKNFCPDLMAQSQSGQESSTRGSVPETKKTIYQARSSISENDTQTTILSKMSEAGLTSKEKALTPYWNESCLEKSKKLLSLTKTGSVGSDLISSEKLQTDITANSWFSTTYNSHRRQNSCRTLFPLSMFSPAGFTDSENTLVRSRKIRIYPNSESRNLLKRYCGLARYWFNKTVEYLKQPKTIASVRKIRSIVQYQLEHEDWAYNSPQRVREFAIADACNAVKNAKMKAKRTGKFNEVNFRSKKNPKQGFCFDTQSLSESSLFKMKKYLVSFFASENINPKLGGCKIVCESDRWFVIIPEEIKVKKPDSQRLGVVALDPGVRTFISYYSDSCFGKLGESNFRDIYRLCYRLDKTISKRVKADSKARRRIGKAICRIRWRIKDLISELHHKTASFLVRNFDTILLPTFETSQMVPGLFSKVARSMLTFAHYKFKQFLKFKAKEYSCTVIDVNEAYTSKTCSYCGKIHNIGNKKQMICSCGANVDRDYNGARGIYIKNISLIDSFSH